MWVHEQDDISNYIGLDTSFNLRLINTNDGSSTLIKAYSGEVNIVFLKRFMIVLYTDGMDRFLYKNEEYSLINYPAPPKLQVNRKNYNIVETEQASTAEAILGKYYAKLNTLSRDDGRLTGGIMIRCALKLFDGSYILHTAPTYIEIGLNMKMREEQVGDGGQDNDLRSTKFYAANLEVKLWKSNYASIDTDIFTHVAIFACKNEELYEFNEDTFNEDVLAEKVTSIDTGDFEVDFKNIFDSVNPDFKEMANSSSWYKIHEIDITKIQAGGTDYIEDLDTTGFYQDYSTRETLPLDQFSHHSLSANYQMNYNSRLVLLDTLSIFGNYNPFYYHITGINYPLSPYVFEEYKEVYFLWTLKTSDGEKKQLTFFGNLGFVTKTGEPSTKKYCHLPPIFGYPDIRASKVEIIVKDGIEYYNIEGFNLKRSSTGNYSYYHSSLFDVDSEQAVDSETNYGWLYINTEFPSSQQLDIKLYTNPRQL